MPVETSPGRVALLETGVAFLLLVFVPVLVASLLFGMGLGGSEENGNGHDKVVAGIWAQLAGLVLLIGYAVIRWRGPSPSPSLSLKARGNLLWAVLIYLAYLLLWVPLAMILYPWVLQQMGETLAPQEVVSFMVEADSSRAGILMVSVLLACVLGPVGEELFFRGFLYSAIQNRLGGGWAVLITSLVFGVSHGHMFTFPIALLGLLFGYLRQKTGGLAAPILAHMLHNILTVMITMTHPEFLDLVFDG